MLLILRADSYISKYMASLIIEGFKQERSSEVGRCKSISVPFVSSRFLAYWGGPPIPWNILRISSTCSGLFLIIFSCHLHTRLHCSWIESTTSTHIRQTSRHAPRSSTLLAAHGWHWHTHLTHHVLHHALH